jgi:hypothetical protein
MLQIYKVLWTDSLDILLYVREYEDWMWCVTFILYPGILFVVLILH